MTGEGQSSSARARLQCTRARLDRLLKDAKRGAARQLPDETLDLVASERDSESRGASPSVGYRPARPTYRARASLAERPPPRRLSGRRVAMGPCLDLTYTCRRSHAPADRSSVLTSGIGMAREGFSEQVSYVQRRRRTPFQPRLDSQRHPFASHTARQTTSRRSDAN
jgi:hypothetical protein